MKVSEGKYFVVSAHREENIDSDKNFAKLVDVINTIAEVFKFPVIISTHPRTQKKSMCRILPLIRWFNF
ncbi:UDP-N-acetylglucosamine 2-epimerase-like protein [Leptospira borgpetersenii serovar Pomona str. 200901868]|uniref:UDP-N-acetylglucosamine 2-epimerase-like protein n=1 Tax=Leptospira borgpetersenii serovar Pomona str. 200901868 TaxID=1192866 RepID=M6VRZ6_LEPBO|nr:UDP-N-acetylglucosamine 2-epimerase-like protein [Leptospira borgpetersenii serovar Pomona str. 200901868]